MIADRDDLLVTVAPGAGHGAPACFLPATATIELDATHLGELDPDTATPDLEADRVRYRIGWGLLVHECAHAQHSRWDVPAGTPAAVGEAAMILEESRVEAAHLARRPRDRSWLRAMIQSLILSEITLDPPTDPTDPTTAGFAGSRGRRGRGRSRSRPRVWCWPASTPGS